MLKKSKPRKKKQEPKEFDGYVLSDDELKELEKYGRSGVAASKKNMEESLNELREQSNG